MHAKEIKYNQTYRNNSQFTRNVGSRETCGKIPWGHKQQNPVVGNITEQIMWFLLQINYIIKEGNLEVSNTMHKYCMDPNLNKHLLFCTAFMR